MKRALFLLALCTCAAADEVLTPEEGQEIHLVFDEPVVSQSAVMNGRNAPPADRGLDLFDVTGDASHPPEACWDAQDRLTISFPEGTSCHTEYRLSFKPGSAHYLSRREMPRREFTFRCPPERLEGCGVPEVPGGAVLVFPEEGLTAEARSFSPEAAVRYAFRLAADGETREVAGEAEPARLKHGLPDELLQRLAVDSTRDWAALGPESPLPGAVLVRPTQPLEAGKDWQLICSGTTDFRESAISADFPQQELDTSVQQCFRDGDSQPQLQVAFSAPIAAEEVPRIFRSMRISAGDAVAELSEDGMSQSLMAGGKPYRFSLEPLPKAHLSPLRTTPLPEPRDASSPGDEAPARRSISYQPQGQVDGFTVAVDAPQPITVDICLPAGTRGVLGLEQADEHLHRLTLNPAWPALDAGGESRLCSLPLKGEHKVRLRSVNLDSLTVTLYRLPHARALPVLQAWPAFHASNKASAQLAEARYRLALLQAQRALGFPVEDKELEKASRLADSRQAVWNNTEPRLAGLLAGAQVAAPKPVDLPQGASLCHAAEWALDLDELAGEPALPGLYVIRLDSVPTPQGKEVGLPEDALRQTTYRLLQISDLDMTASGSLMLVTRLSDGSAVEEGEARFLPGGNKFLESSRPVPFAHGMADFRSVSGEGLVQVIAGDDSCLRPSYFPRQDKGKQLRASLVTERNLYRPGETVHVRGVLRAVGAKGEVSLPHARPVMLSVDKPNGEVLLRRRLPLDSYGAFETEWTLPTGEEDVAGAYSMTVKSGSFVHRETISCQVFRRDAFTAEARLEMNPVAPRSFAVHVRAQDYNGVPLAGGKVELCLSASMPMGIGGSSPVPADGEEKNISLALGEDGTAALEGQVGAVGEGEGFLSLSGSVANDRGEYVKLPAVQAACFPADFAIHFRDDTLYLDDAAAAEEEEEKKPSPLPRAQRVHVRLEAEVKTPTLLPQGLFILWDRETVPVWQGEVEVPAGCLTGTPLALRQHWESFEARHPWAENPTLTISGADAAGRQTRWQQRYIPFPRPGLQCQDATLQCQDGSLHVSTTLEHGGEAHIILTSPAGARRISQRVRPGHNAFSLPLEEGEEGTLSLCLLLPIQEADGAFRPGEYAMGQVETPHRRGKLDVSWEMPTAPCRPGGRISLGGQVRQAGGDAPAAEAAVTLFAVDAGMLSVDAYEPPDWLRLLTARPLHAFRPPYKSGIRPGRRGHVRLMEPLWPGIRLRRDGSFHPQSFSSFPEGGFSFFSSPAFRPTGAAVKRSMQAAPTPCMDMEASPEENTLSFPRVRTHFNPVAFWFPALLTDENGRFSAQADLPDTLTSYKVYALVLGKDGSHFGKGETSFTVSQPLMLTPGTPLFMSTGDTLRLPLTVTNNSDEAGVWHVSMPGEAAPQSVRLPAHGSTTLYSDCTASAEGDCTLQWSASCADADHKKAPAESGDAVAATFPVRFPAPLLKEHRHLTLHAEEKKPLDLRSLLAPEFRDAVHGQMRIEMSANPLLHVQGCMELLLNYPYGCTEQVASGLLTWLLHSRLAPFHARMAAASPEQARQTVAKGIARLLQRQQADGGLAYWSDGQGSCFWASAYAALVLTLAEEEGVSVPPKPLEALRAYLLSREKENKEALSPFIRYAIGRACGDSALMASALNDALDEAVGKAEGNEKSLSQEGWFRTRQSTASLRFLAALQTGQRTEQEVHAAFLAWLRTAGHDYRHSSTWDGGWMLLALHEYLLTLPNRHAPATVRLGDGTELALGQGPTNLALADFSHPGTLQATSGTAYVTVKAKAQPNKTRYPGVTEKGLQVTRLYEKKGEDGIWRPASDFKVGDVVRVTLTCAKAGRDLQYFVLEDYLPACMEAINPAVPSQAAGLDWQPWSSWFDHKEFLADRVRGFCTRWGGERVLNMSYYARVKRAGISTAPPAQAQLMYEPQTYGLSENNVIISQ